MIHEETDERISSQKILEKCSSTFEAELIIKTQHVSHGNLLQNHFGFFLNFFHTEISIIFLANRPFRLSVKN